jgi:protein gp37
MTENSKIGWTDHTANTHIGCTKIAAGCTNCYAEEQSGRWRWASWGPGQPRKRVADETWYQWRKWEVRAAATGRRELVFCGSLMDWCDEEAPLESLARIHEAWRGSPHLLWLMLTKRVGRIEECLPADFSTARYPNVALGYSIAEPKDLGWIDDFCAIPAAFHFLSYEPALEWCDLRPWLRQRERVVVKAGYVSLLGRSPVPAPRAEFLERPAIQQVIIGGESGPRARPFNVRWAEDTLRNCQAAGVRCFIKQMGRRVYVTEGAPLGRWWPAAVGQFMEDPMIRVVGAAALLKLADRKGEDPAEWPEALRVQERLIDMA